VTQVRIVGAKAVPADRTKAVLGQRETPWYHFVPLLNFITPEYRLEGTTWEQDRTRIANFYAEQGYFDARVIGSQVQRGRQRRKDGSAVFVRIVHQVEEGKPSLVRGVTVAADGDAGILADVDVSRWLTKGKPWRKEDVDRATLALREACQEQGRALASVESRVDAFPEEHAVDVAFRVVLGPQARFGPVEIRGVEDAETRREVERRVAIREGDPFAGRAVRETQREVYGMGIFSLVTVTPDFDAARAAATGLQDGQAVAVPVTIVLAESKARTLQWGGGLGWEIGRIDGHGAVSIVDVNLGRKLIRGEVGLLAGLTFMTEEDWGPFGDLTFRLLAPVPRTGLRLTGEGGIRLRVEQGYKYWSPLLSGGVTWNLWKPLRLDAGVRFAYFDLFPQERVEKLNTAALDFDYPDGYLLPLLHQTVTLDLRDDPLAPGRGLFTQVALAEAPGPTYEFVRADVDLRGYVPLGTERLVLAGRARWAQVFPDPERVDVPPTERLYLGGDGSVRGWRKDHLGPRTLEPECDRRDCIVPTGGTVLVNGSVELRGNLVGPIWLAGFLDGGRVWALAGDADWRGGGAWKDLELGFGGGLRVSSPIGRIRIDVGVHPKAWTGEEFWGPVHTWKGKDVAPPFWNLHFAIGESF
jgi:outer membrane protein assembly factor BamA